MGFSVTATAEPQCDVCGMDSEPCEMTGTSSGGFSLDGPMAEMERDGWKVERNGYFLTCPECQAEQSE